MNLEAAAVASWLNRLPFVRWDRCIRVPVPGEEHGAQHETLAVYGWIARPDGLSDFVFMEFTTWDDTPGYSTSSAARSEEINRLLYGSDAPHYECVRIEDELGDLVPNRVGALSHPGMAWR